MLVKPFRGWVLCFLLIVLYIQPVHALGAKTGVRILYYVIGSDLESMSGAASNDLREMLRADLPADTEVYILTGGAKHWSLNSGMDGKTTLLTLMNHQFISLDFPSDIPLSSPETLRIFLARCAPDDKPWHLILWGHGISTPPSIGWDETSTVPTMAVSALAEVLHDLEHPPLTIGLDACRMASVEVCWLLSDCATALIADRAEENLTGWPQHLILNGLTGQPETDLHVITHTAGFSADRKGKNKTVVCIPLKGFRSRMWEPLQAIMAASSAPETPFLLSDLLSQANDPALSQAFSDVLDSQDLLLLGKNAWLIYSDLFPDIGPYLAAWQ